MSIVYQKWRDLIINPFNIKFNCIKINRIISYPPAGNDVVECLCEINGDVKNIFIKIERSKVCDFTTEVNNLNYLKVIIIILEFQMYLKVAFMMGEDILFYLK